MEEHRNSLQPGYRLHWYVIKSILGQGGFGITYLAEDTNLNQEVAIKEFLPIELAVREQDASIYPVSGEHGEQFRWGLDRFMSEAQTLAQFKHPNIVRVLTVFPENNTAYMVMEYEKGQGMQDLLKERKTLNETELNCIFLPILDGLEQVHNAGFIHRDIKPPNIFIRADGSPVLLDFGSARQSLGEKTHTLTSLVSPGYAPFEQYVSKSDKQGPWTDIYGLAATLYRSVIGRSPAEAMDRSEGLLHTNRDPFVTTSEINPEGYSRSFLMAIDHGLAFKTEDRPQSISQWRAEFLQSLTALQSTEAETIQVQAPDGPSTKDSSKHRAAKITIKADEVDRVISESTIKEKRKPWYRKPLKIIAVVFGVLLLLAILDDNKKQNEGKNVEALSENDEVQISRSKDTPINIDRLLLDADKDISALRLTSPKGNNAVEKYQQVLRNDPDNTLALDGMNNVAGKYLGLAEKSLQKGDLQQASEYVDKAAGVYSEHPGIRSLTATIAQQKYSDSIRDTRVKDVPTSTDTGVISDSEKKKLLKLKRQLTRNPENQKAKQELRKIIEKVETVIKKAFAEKNYRLAASYVDVMLELSPDNRRLLELRNTIKEKQAAD
jgi:serine/threonine protein kinase